MKQRNENKVVWGIIIMAVVLLVVLLLPLVVHKISKTKYKTKYKTMSIHLYNQTLSMNPKTKIAKYEGTSVQCIGGILYFINHLGYSAVYKNSKEVHTCVILID